MDRQSLAFVGLSVLIIAGYLALTNEDDSTTTSNESNDRTGEVVDIPDSKAPASPWGGTWEGDGYKLVVDRSGRKIAFTRPNSGGIFLPPEIEFYDDVITYTTTGPSGGDTFELRQNADFHSISVHKNADRIPLAYLYRDGEKSGTAVEGGTGVQLCRPCQGTGRRPDPTDPGKTIYCSPCGGTGFIVDRGNGYQQPAR